MCGIVTRSSGYHNYPSPPSLPAWQSTHLIKTLTISADVNSLAKNLQRNVSVCLLSNSLSLSPSLWWEGGWVTQYGTRQFWENELTCNIYHAVCSSRKASALSSSSPSPGNGIQQSPKAPSYWPYHSHPPLNIYSPLSIIPYYGPQTIPFSGAWQTSAAAAARWDESSNLLSQCHAFWINKYFHSTYTMGRQFAAEKNPKQTHWGHVHHRRRSRRVVKRISVFVSRPSWSWINKWIRGVNKELWRPDITLFISAKKIYIHRSTNTMPSCFVYQCGPEQRGSSSFSYQDQQWNSIKLEEHSSLEKENFTAKGIYKGPTFDFFKVHRPQGVINMLIISNSLSYHHPSSPK